MSSVLIELTQAQLDSIASQQAGTPPSGVGAPADVVTYEHGAQQPNVVQPNGGIYVADLTFNGKRFATNGLAGQPPFYFRFSLPAGFTAWDGLVAQISYSEHAEHGGMQFTKTAGLSKTPMDFATNVRYGSSSSYLVSFNCDYPGAIRLNSGEDWYLNVRYTREDGTPSAKATDDGDMQVTPGAPSVGA